MTSLPVAIGHAETAEAMCPASSAIGSRVGLVTLKALLSPDGLRRLDGEAYRFCPDRSCEIVYFDRAADSVFRKQDLRIRVGLKETDPPITLCYCFDVTETDLRLEISVKGRSGYSEKIAAEVRAGHCACEVRNPSGLCCLKQLSHAEQSILRAL